MNEKIFKVEDIDKISNSIIKEIKKKKRSNATVLAFSGDLGSGKTTITQSLSRVLGVEDSVISPTFVIMKIYKTKDERFKNLIHIDAYRLNNHEELLCLGWEEIVENKDNLIVIEWPERVIECLPVGVYNIKLEHKDECTRSINFCL